MKCKCGGELKLVVSINDDFEFYLGENGEIEDLDVFEGMTIKEYILERLDHLEQRYVCEECGREHEEI